jgi:hypothetical protein
VSEVILSIALGPDRRRARRQRAADHRASASTPRPDADRDGRSEVARNASAAARGGKVPVRLEGVTPPQLLTIAVTDRGPGIADVAAGLEGRYRSDTGMGLGIAGTRRLMDRFTIASAPGEGTTVTFGKFLPRRRGLVRPDALMAAAESIARQRPADAVDDQQQNQEPLRGRVVEAADGSSRQPRARGRLRLLRSMPSSTAGRSPPARGRGQDEVPRT